MTPASRETRSLHARDRRASTQALALAGGVALLLAGLGGFALLSLPEPDPAAEPREPLDGVPDEVDYVGYLDAGEYRSDDDAELATRRALRFQSLVQFYDGPPFRDSFALGSRDSELDSTAAREVTYFGRHNSSYEARIVVGNWSAAELAAAVEADANVTLDATEVNGTTLYRGGGLAVARLGNDSNATVLAVGNETAVRDALDVTGGGAEGVVGPLRSEFEERSGYVRFAYRFRPFRVPNYPFVGEAVESVEYVSSEYALNRSAGGASGTATAGPASANATVRVRIDITTADSTSARDVRTIMNAGVTFYRVESGNDTLRDELARVELPDVEGRTVSLRYESTPSGLRVLVRGLFRNQPEPSGRLVVERGVGA